jgi:lipoprotein NlpI
MIWIASLISVGAALAGFVDAPPQTAADYIDRGMQEFQTNKIAESLRDFDRAAELDPAGAPFLWQRGISDYYGGKFQEGRRQFESHKSVNPDDVENAAWHFLCVARADGLDAARKALIKIDVTRDSRVPMAEVYDYYAGRGSAEAVLAAAKKEDTERARMYAHLYLGLYDEVAGDVPKAREHLRQAAAARLQKDYMHNVAKIHLLQRKWDR